MAPEFVGFALLLCHVLGSEVSIPSTTETVERSCNGDVFELRVAGPLTHVPPESLELFSR